MGLRAVLGTWLRLGSRLDPDSEADRVARSPDRAVREGDAGEREGLGRRPGVPAQEPRAARGARLPGADRARGVRRPWPGPRRLRDDLRDDRALRLCLHGHVLRDALRRGQRDHAAPHRGADRQVHPPAEQRQDRHAVLLGPRDRLALLVPDLLRRRARERRLQGAQEGLLDDLRRLRRLLRDPDHEPRLLRLRRPLGVRGGRRRDQGRARQVGRARTARQPVGRARGA